MDYKKAVRKLPDSPGVYIMKDAEGAVLYIGKALNIRKRVASYFHPRSNISGRIRTMIGKVADISHIDTVTEAEALIYENGLIKQLSPRYNVALRDGKSYPMLKLSVNEKFPRLFITRQRKDDGALYYGPYTNAKLLREAFMMLKQIFPLRSCNRMPKAACLDYHIKQCLAPCVGEVDGETYGEIVDELKLFLEGRTAELLKTLSGRMLEASAKAEFEKAARIRRRIELIGAVKKDTVRYGPASEIGELKAILGIKDGLDVIEAFDVSDIMGKDAVGSMIYFYKGRPKRDGYRKFRIKTVPGMDDYAMMREIVRRRYSRLLEEGGRLPDLILIDGGKGHMAAGVDELERMGIRDIPAIGIAKRFEHIYVKGRRDPIVLPRESKTLHLLERVRDEAHRFAISYHKRLRTKRIRSSELDDIKGVGAKRKNALLNHFGTVDNIRAAVMSELLKVGGMSEKSARAVIDHFKKR